MTKSKFVIDTKTVTVKVVVAGPGGVGKTTLIKRYETNNYIPAVSTVGINFLVMDQEVGETVLRIAYWDYAGEDRFRSLFPGYCQGSSGALIAFDTSRIQTLSELTEWLGMIREHNNPDIPIILVGNKIDTASEKTKKMVTKSATNFTKKYKLAGYYLCSAKSGEGMEEPFTHLGILIVENNKRLGKI